MPEASQFLGGKADPAQAASVLQSERCARESGTPAATHSEPAKNETLLDKGMLRSRIRGALPMNGLALRRRLPVLSWCDFAAAAAALASATDGGTRSDALRYRDYWTWSLCVQPASSR